MAGRPSHAQGGGGLLTDAVVSLTTEHGDDDSTKTLPRAPTRNEGDVPDDARTKALASLRASASRRARHTWRRVFLHVGLLNAPKAHAPTDARANVAEQAPPRLLEVVDKASVALKARVQNNKTQRRGVGEKKALAPAPNMSGATTSVFVDGRCIFCGAGQENAGARQDDEDDDEFRYLEGVAAGATMREAIAVWRKSVQPANPQPGAQYDDDNGDVDDEASSSDGSAQSPRQSNSPWLPSTPSTPPPALTPAPDRANASSAPATPLTGALKRGPLGMPSSPIRSPVTRELDLRLALDGSQPDPAEAAKRAENVARRAMAKMRRGSLLRMLRAWLRQARIFSCARSSLSGHERRLSSHRIRRIVRAWRSSVGTGAQADALAARRRLRVVRRGVLSFAARAMRMWRAAAHRTRSVRRVVAKMRRTKQLSSMRRWSRIAKALQRRRGRRTLRAWLRYIRTRSRAHAGLLHFARRLSSYQMRRVVRTWRNRVGTGCEEEALAASRRLRVTRRARRGALLAWQSATRRARHVRSLFAAAGRRLGRCTRQYVLRAWRATTAQIIAFALLRLRRRGTATRINFRAWRAISKREVMVRDLDLKLRERRRVFATRGSLRSWAALVLLERRIRRVAASISRRMQRMDARCSFDMWRARVIWVRGSRVALWRHASRSSTRRKWAILIAWRRRVANSQRVALDGLTPAGLRQLRRQAKTLAVSERGRASAEAEVRMLRPLQLEVSRLVATCDAKDGALKACQAESAAATVLLETELETSRAESRRLEERVKNLEQQLSSQVDQQARDNEAVHSLIQHLGAAACARHANLRRAVAKESNASGQITFERLSELLSQHFGVNVKDCATTAPAANLRQRDGGGGSTLGTTDWHAFVLSPVREWR
ncbi:hypothetical protein RI054_01g05610 [Pseudoscourfieldia marina]